MKIHNVIKLAVVGCIIWSISNSVGSSSYVNKSGNISDRITHQNPVANNIKEKAFISYENVESWRMSENMDIVVKMEYFNQVSTEEQMEWMDVIERIESRYLGMLDSVPDIRIQDCEENVLGYYSFDQDYIALDNDLIESGDGYYILSVMEHELYHRYEYYQIMAYEVLKNSEYGNLANLNVFHDASVYEKELGDYIESKDDFEGYYSQRVERDSRKYANSRILYEDYYQACRDYYEENGMYDPYKDVFYESAVCKSE